MITKITFMVELLPAPTMAGAQVKLSQSLREDAPCMSQGCQSLQDRAFYRDLVVEIYIYVDRPYVNEQ